MDAEKLFDAIRQQPFLPARIHLTDGSHYDITHPDQILITKRWSCVGLRADGEKVFENDAVVDNLHITRINPLNRSDEN